MKQKKVRGTFTRTRRIIAGAIVLSLMTSCEVIRTITTTAESKQIDDKNVIVQTKTIESYVGTKK